MIASFSLTPRSLLARTLLVSGTGKNAFAAHPCKMRGERLYRKNGQDYSSSLLRRLCT